MCVEIGLTQYTINIITLNLALNMSASNKRYKIIKSSIQDRTVCGQRLHPACFIYCRRADEGDAAKSNDCGAQRIFNTLNRAATVQRSLRAATHANVSAGVNTIGPLVPRAALGTSQDKSKLKEISTCFSKDVCLNKCLIFPIPLDVRTGWLPETITISLFTASQTGTPPIAVLLSSLSSPLRGDTQ